MSLEKVNIELKEANIKLEDLKLEAIDTNEYLNLTNDTFTEKLTELINFFKGSSLKELEQKREERAFQEKLLSAMQDNNKNSKIPAEKKKEEGSSLGLLLGALAVGAGALAGAFKASFDVLKILVTDVSKLLTGLFKAITPTAILKEIDLFVDFVKLVVSKLKLGVTSVIDDVVKLFTYVGDYFKGIKDSISKIPGLSGINTLIDDIVKMFGKFGTVFSGVFKVVSKIFTPLFTLYETVKGAIQGYGEEGDVAGAIIGAIKGFFKGLVGDFLNLIKDLVSWVVGALGFKKLEALLDSFDFNTLFNSVFDGVIEFFKGISKWISDKFNAVKAFFGYGGEEKESELKTAEARRKRVEGAQAVAIDPKTGTPVTMTSITNGIYDPERAKEELVKLGLKPMSDDEKKVYEEKLKEEENIKRKAIEEFKGAYKLNDVIPDILDAMFGVITDAKDFIIAKFESAAKFVADIMPNTDVVKEFLKSVLRNVLPIADSGKKWYDVGNLVSKAIPNSVYKFAGIDPKTGALTEEPKVDTTGAQQIIAPSVTRNEQMTREMAQSQEEQQILMDQAAAGSGGSILSQSSTVNNMTNNNTTVVKPSPSATRVPQAASDMFYTQMGYGYAAP